MARTIIVNHNRDTRVPFLRGILTRSLQKAGLSFKDAYDLASELRDDISQLDEITNLDLRKRVMRFLDKQCSASVSQRYQTNQSIDQTVLIRDIDQQAISFSRGLHRQVLKSLGIPSEQAAAIINRLHQELLALEDREISSRQLGHMLHQAIRRDTGNKMAQRYLIWTAFRSSERPLIILIGGVPGCGKSTVSVELANRMDIVRTQSTEMLREVMRMMMPERLAPVLHTSSLDAWRTLSTSSDSEATELNQAIANGYFAQAEMLSVPCEAVVRRVLREKVSLVLEGVHIQPALVNKLPVDDAAIVVPMILAVMNPDDLRKRIRRKEGLVPRSRADRYLHHFDGIWHLQTLLLSEADQLGIPIVNSTDRESAILGATTVIMEALAGEFSVDIETVFGPATVGETADHETTQGAAAEQTD